MGWMEGLMTGYMDRHYEVQKEEMRQAELAAAREGQVYQTLLNSEYPEIRDYAAAGILDLASPRRRKGGLAGWMGEVEQSPYLDTIRRAKARIEGQPNVEALPRQPSVPTVGGALPMPVAPTGSAAQPSTSLVTGGQPTPVQPAPAARPPSPAAASAAVAPGGPGADVSMRVAPRSTFPSERAQRGLESRYAQAHTAPGQDQPVIFPTPYVGPMAP